MFKKEIEIRHLNILLLHIISIQRDPRKIIQQYFGKTRCTHDDPKNLAFNDPNRIQRSSRSNISMSSNLIDQVFISKSKPILPESINKKSDN